MRPIVTVFESSPDEGRGLARDMRVRWALEEVGQPYDVDPISFDRMKQPAYLALHPFGQIPVYRSGDLALFESGAIALHVAMQYEGLLPDDDNARARAVAWTIAALTTVEPPIVEREQADLTERDAPWYADRLPIMDVRIRDRLDRLAAALEARAWFDGAFSVADLTMVLVLRRLEGTAILDGYPTLADYVARGEARPAYRRAFAAQRALFDATRT